MSEKPKRPWFRFHLLTLVLMMFAAGVLTWENVKRFNPPVIYGAAHHELGWPWIGMYRWTPNVRAIKGPDPVEQRYFNGWLLVADFACGIAAVVMVGVVSEYLIRRREARKP